MDYRQLLQSLKQGPPATVYLLHGQEEYVKDEMLKQIASAALSGGIEAIDQQNIDGDNCTVDQLIAACETLPMMSPRRVVVVRREPMLAQGGKGRPKAEAQAILERIADLPPSVCLIFRAQGSVPKSNALQKAVEKAGKVVEFAPLSDSELRKWIRQTAGKYGKAIGPQQADLLVEMSGRKLEDLLWEIKKLADYAGDRGEMTSEDIAVLATRDSQYNVFKMVDALCAGRTGDALSMLGDMLTGKEEPTMILAMIARQLRMMLGALRLKRRGSNVQQMESVLQARAFAIRNALAQAAHVDDAAIEEMLRKLYQTDLGIKSGVYRDAAAALQDFALWLGLRFEAARKRPARQVR